MSLNFKYKYSLKERLESLPHQEYKGVIKDIPKALQISRSTFKRYLETRIGDSYSIPGDHLARLAKYLNCQIEDLLNFDPLPLSKKSIGLRTEKELACKLSLVK